MPAVIVLETQQVVAEPGQTAVARIRIRNTGRIVDEFAVDIVGAPRAWAEVRPPLVRLFPGAEGVAEVLFAPPRAPSARAGRHPFGVRVVPRDDPSSSVVEEGAIEVSRFIDVRAEVTPVAPRGHAGASASLRIANLGNAPTRVSVSARSSDDLATIRVDPTTVEVPAGERSTARLGIRSRGTVLRGPVQVHPFVVTVSVDDRVLARLDARYFQTALLPGWVVLVLGAVVLASGAVLAVQAGLIGGGPTQSAAPGPASDAQASPAASVEPPPTATAAPTGTTSASPADTSTPTDTITPEPPPSPTPVIRAAGELSLSPGFAADLDAGTIVQHLPGGPGDVVLSATLPRFIVAIEGALLAQLGNQPVGYDGCVAAAPSETNMLATGLQPGSRLCVLTSEGRYVEVEVIEVAANLRFRYTTWQS